eukprot:TRINITY_DN758_c2_g1_i2.p1 TRINITY_DN758_c2_g1~~TRINITY_DN758_c2_g1_i2.p1  ORF type:complete len:483 (-),score=158.31 TRINITY_DN758_c2_g1_i2:70-1518(-)
MGDLLSIGFEVASFVKESIIDFLENEIFRKLVNVIEGFNGTLLKVKLINQNSENPINKAVDSVRVKMDDLFNSLKDSENIPEIKEEKQKQKEAKQKQKQKATDKIVKNVTKISKKFKKVTIAKIDRVIIEGKINAFYRSLDVLKIQIALEKTIESVRVLKELAEKDPSLIDISEKDMADTEIEQKKLPPQTFWFRAFEQDQEVLADTFVRNLKDFYPSFFKDDNPVFNIICQSFFEDESNNISVAHFANYLRDFGSLNTILTLLRRLFDECGFSTINRKEYLVNPNDYITVWDKFENKFIIISKKHAAFVYVYNKQFYLNSRPSPTSTSFPNFPFDTLKTLGFIKGLENKIKIDNYNKIKINNENHNDNDNDDNDNYKNDTENDYDKDQFNNEIEKLAKESNAPNSTKEIVKNESHVYDLTEKMTNAVSKIVTVSIEKLVPVLVDQQYKHLNQEAADKSGKGASLISIDEDALAKFIATGTI